ncbi:MAG: class I SAM-dependent methyltransferase [Thermoanaerobaculia bacterium]
MRTAIPVPPIEMRKLVGPTDEAAFDNPTGDPVVSGLGQAAWDYVLDFGCGCGRLARQIMQQRLLPKRYLGLDLHAGMIRWCKTNLGSIRSEFEFIHQDVFNLGFNPTGKLDVASLPVGDRTVSLFLAWSVFTHLLEGPAHFYLRELSRVLRPGGYASTTWFLFDKREYPMMQTFQNALFINSTDPTNAVIFDRSWLQDQFRTLGLVPVEVRSPEIRGYQWQILLRPSGPGVEEAQFPVDSAPTRSLPPPELPPNADRLGLED